MMHCVLRKRSLPPSRPHGIARRRCDDVVGVSESIIMGIPMPVGTGIFRIRQNCAEVGELPRAPAPVIGRPRGVAPVPVG